MKKMLAYAVFGILLILLTGCVISNRFYVPPDFAEADLQGAADGQHSSDTLKITTWNIGYAGMGAESDFIFDKGEQRRPLSADLVDTNLQAIKETLASFDSDVLLLQEAARPSWVTYRRDVLAGVVDALPGHTWTFGADINTRFVPPPFNVEVGNANFARIASVQAERRGLPLEPTFEYGLFRKGYRMHIMRTAGTPSWVIVNVHLSTFDSAEDDVRGAQVAALIEFAEAEYAKGNRVVIGGDWNLRLVDTDFAHTTEEKFLFWIRDFPQEELPSGWRWAVDESVATVRTANKPYVSGENYTLIIDGFLVSPNVEILTVDTKNLNFRHTDHQPVTAHLKGR